MQLGRLPSSVTVPLQDMSRDGRLGTEIIQETQMSLAEAESTNVNAKSMKPFESFVKRFALSPTSECCFRSDFVPRSLLAAAASSGY